MNDEVGGFVKLLVVAVVIVALLPSFLAIGPSDGSEALTAPLDERVTVDSTQSEIPARVSVDATKGNALYFDGSSYVSSADPGALDNGSWSVCVSAQLDPDANPDATYSAYAYENETILLEYDAGEWNAYYDNGTADGMATVTAPETQEDDGVFFGWFSNDDGGKDFAQVCGVYDSSSNELTVTADGEQSSSSLTNATTPRSLSQNWIGTLEEVRTFGGSLSDSQVDRYMSDPVQPLDGADRTSRMMFDEGTGSTTEVYFAGSSATIHGASWTDGVEGPPLEEGTDYELHEDPFAVTILSGGYLDGSPVQYVSWSPLIPFGIISLMGTLFALLLMVVFANRIQDFL